MDPVLLMLSELGLGVATSAIYDFLKSLVSKPLDQKTITEEIQNRIDLNGVSMRAETVISALTQNGFLSIQNSQLYATDSLVFGSQGGAAMAGNNTVLQTSKTAVVAGQGAAMRTQGHAQIRQNSDGSITFHTGSDGNIGFHTGGKGDV